MEGRSRILLVGNSPHNLSIHAVTLQDCGYDVVTAHDQAEALEVVAHHTPDLLLLEAGGPGMDGFSACCRLKAVECLANVPAIFITESRSAEVVNLVYASGGVDFIVKPCPLSEFLARIETQIRLHDLLLEVEKLQAIAIDANPLTHLPGNNTIVQTIQSAIDQGSDSALIYTDLDNFKSYNDVYGFSAGDDVLLFNANTLQDVLRQVCGDDAFLGHIGGDDFVLMLPAGKLDEVGGKIVQAFDEGIPEFYNDADRRRGGIIATDRSGGVREYPLVSISLAGIRLLNHDFSRYVEVAAACADLKKEAKARPGSNLFVDRRVALTR